MSVAMPAIPSPYIHSSQKRRKNVWYSIKDGNWNDPNIWASNALSYCPTNFNYPGEAVPSPIFPAIGDDVYINHVVTLNVGSSITPMVLNNIYISGTLKADNSGRILVVNGNFQAVGTVDFTGSNINVKLYNVNNYIVNFIWGNSTITYTSLVYIQPTTDGTVYNNLTITARPMKYLTNNCIVNGKLTVGAIEFGGHSIFDLKGYDLTVYGQSQVGLESIEQMLSTLKTSGSSNVLFVGSVNLGNSGNNYTWATIDFTGSTSNVECRGGMTAQNATPSQIKSGEGTWKFTTNNQTGIVGTFNCPVTIGAGLTISTSAVLFNDIINGVDANSKLINAGTFVLGGMYFGTLASTGLMSTGTFDHLSVSLSILGYWFSGDYQIPYSEFQSLTIGDGTVTGTKTFPAAPITIHGNLVVNSNSAVDFEGNDLFIGGTTTIANAGIIKKSGAGNMVFGGFCNLLNFNLTGNPNVEFQGGVSIANNIQLGTGIFKFTTNNQNLNTITNQNISVNINLLISGAISVSGSKSGGSAFTMNGVLNGDSASSTYVNNGNFTIYNNATQPMAVGVLDCTTSGNTFTYNGASQEIKGTTYYILVLSGSGVKKLMGNVVINTSAGGSWSLGGTATIDYNGFTITTI